MKLLHLIFAALLTCSLANAKGPGSGNGGNAAVDGAGDVHFLDLVRLPGTVIYSHKGTPPYLALEAQMSKHDGYRDATYFPWIGPEETSSIKDKVMDSLDHLTFHVVLNGAPLPDPHDKGVVVLPWNHEGHVERLALQEIQSGKVLVDGRLLEKMSNTDVAALFEHEALIHVWYQGHAAGSRLQARLKSTDRIADIVNMTFVESRFTRNLSAEALSAKMCEAGINVGATPLAGYRITQDATDRALHPKAQPLPDDFWVMLEETCTVRHFHKKGSWTRSRVGGGFIDDLTLTELHQGRQFDAELMYTYHLHDDEILPDLALQLSTQVPNVPIAVDNFPKNFSIWVK